MFDTKIAREGLAAWRPNEPADSVWLAAQLSDACDRIERLEPLAETASVFLADVDFTETRSVAGEQLRLFLKDAGYAAMKNP